MSKLSFDDIRLLLENSHQSDGYKEIIEQSLFYYCCGRDITPIMAFREKYPLYVYSDILNYGRSNLGKETSVVYERLKSNNFLCKNLRSLHFQSFDADSELSEWTFLDKSFYLLYVGADASKTFEHFYHIDDELILPECICNIRYEIKNRTLISRQEHKVNYLLGHCYDEEYTLVEKYDYFGDYGSTSAKIGLYESPNVCYKERSCYGKI